MRPHPYTLGSSEIEEMGEAKHTPTPWFLDPDDREGMDWNVHICSDEARKQRICFMANGPLAERDAEFITRACNAHDDLVAALKHCLREHGGFHIAGESERLARAALAKAEGHS